MAAIVYLGEKAMGNFETALKHGVWGCKVDQGWEDEDWSLEAGDHVLFISRIAGGRRNIGNWNSRDAEGCVLATVSKGWHENQDNIWGANPLYEFRFAFEGALEIGSRSLNSLGPKVSKAARLAMFQTFKTEHNGTSRRNVQYVKEETFGTALEKGLKSPPKAASASHTKQFAYGKRYERESRPEQGLFRDLLIKTYGTQCALCHRELDRQFLVAAHIKKRSKCNDSEKSDIGNIGMLACTLGCDAAYEQGLITVSAKGRTVKNPSAPNTFPLASKAFAVTGKKKVKVWQNHLTRKYFKWHRTEGPGAS